MESVFTNGGMIGQPMNFFDPTNYIVDTTTEVIICGTAGENGTVNLSTPSGQPFTRVAFASYGTPSGTCPNYTIGGCHASNSVSVVQSYAIGNSSVSIPASNGVFGDPCPGTPKQLYVALAYNVGGIGPGNKKNSGIWPVSSYIGEFIPLSFVSSNVAYPSSTITIPAAAQAGDLCVLLDGCVNNASADLPPNAIPSGFTQIMTSAFVRTGNTSARMTCSYKILEVGDPSSTITGLSSTNPRKIVMIFRPSTPIRSVIYSQSIVNRESPNEGTTETLEALVERRINSILISNYISSSTVSSLQSSPTNFNATITNGSFHQAGYTIFNNTPQNQTIVANKASTTVDASFNMFAAFSIVAY